MGVFDLVRRTMSCKEIYIISLAFLTTYAKSETWYIPQHVPGPAVSNSASGACDLHKDYLQQQADDSASQAGNWEERSINECGNSDDQTGQYVIYTTRASDGVWISSNVWVAEKIVCDSDQTFDLENRACVSPVYCEPGYLLNSGGDSCQAHCEMTQGWDSSEKQCTEDEAPPSCESQTDHPIDLIEGRKYRTEKVLSVGNRFPIDLKFFYNSQRARELLGRSAVSHAASYVADSHPPYSANNAPPTGVSLYSQMYWQQQADAGGISRYWRHNYQDALYSSLSGKYYWHRADGQLISFAGDGSSRSYAKLQLQALNAGEVAEYGFDGHKIISGRFSTVRIFDDSGRLRRLIDPATKLYQSLSYNSDGMLESIIHSNGAQLIFEYSARNTSDQNAAVDRSSFYVSAVEDGEGRRVELEWNAVYSGQARTYYLLTKIARLSGVAGNSYREYFYENTDFPAALTRIDDVLDYQSNIRQTYAEFQYDETGRATYSGLANGVEGVSVDYPSPVIRKVTNALGKEAIYNFTSINAVKRLTSVVGEPTATCLQSETSYTYNANGTRSEKLSNGTRTLYSYNSRGLEISRTEAAGTADEITTTTEWHPDFNRPTKVSTPNRTTRYVYDSNELLKEMHIDADGETRTTLYTYYPNRLLQSVDGPRTDVNDITSYTYDSQLNLATVTNALNHTVTYSQYNSQGQVGKVVDANGVISLINYTLTGEVASVTRVHPTDSTRSVTTDYTYNPLGQLESVSLPGGATIYYHYDQARRLEAISNNLGERLDYGLDLAGNITEETIKNSSGTIVYQVNRAYDELSRLMDIVGAVNESAHFTYDADDNLTSATNGRNHTTSYQYDNLNRLKTVLEPLQQTTGFEYNSSGELTRVTDAETLETHYGVNGFGDLVKLTSPDTGITDYSYDSAGNLVQTIDSKNTEVLYSFDALNRLEKIEYPASPGETIRYGYDDTALGNLGLGRLTSISDQSGETLIHYNYLGKIDQKDIRVDSHWYTISYQYDDSGRLSGLVYPSGRIVDYGFDDLGRIASISTKELESATSQVVVSFVGYLPFGPVKNITFGNGITHSREYDLSYRPVQLEEQKTSILRSKTFQYDANSNITGINDLVDSVLTQVFGYDAVDRVESAMGSYGQLNYGYDKVGNRLSRNKNIGSINESETYDYSLDSHRLLGVERDGGDDTDFVYDEAGNLENRVTGINTQQWEYNSQNRPARMVEGGTTVEFRYNAAGQRVYRAAGSEIRHFHYDQQGLLFSVHDESGAVLEEHIWLGDQQVAVVLDESQAQDNYPIIVITQPANPARILQGEPLTLQATASDSSGDLSSEIQWSSSTAGSLGVGNSIQISLATGTHNIKAAVRGSTNLLSETQHEVLVFESDNPAISIIDPQNNITYVIGGSTIQLSAEASDRLDGDITENIVWASSLDGALGGGNKINPSLSVGNHTITAEVTDSDSNIATVIVEIIVVDGSDSDGDQLADDWEVLKFGNLDESSEGDPDNDGYTNLEEYGAGTHPLQPNIFNTLDLGKTSPTINLSEDKRTATSTISGWATAYSKESMPGGSKYYWEVSVVAGSGYTQIGIGSVAPLNNYLGSVAETYGWNNYGAGRLNFYNSYAGFADYSDSDRVMVAYDADEGKLWYGLNGAWFGDPNVGTGEQFNNITGLQYPAVAVYAGSSATVFFESAQLLYAPPIGYTLLTETDVDQDGLSDAWEIDYFGAMTETGTGDFDSDGLSNAAEEELGTDPTDGVADSDGDGLPDVWEYDYFASLEIDGLSDIDGDGLTQQQEYSQGSDPTKYPNLNSLVTANSATDLTLSEEGRSVSNLANLWRSAFTEGALLSNQKYYWEAEVSSGYMLVGIGSDVPLQSYLGSTAGSYGWHSGTSAKLIHGDIRTNFLEYNPGDRVMIAFDGTSGKLWFGKNGVWSGDPAAGTGEQYSGISGSQYPAISVYGGEGSLYFGPIDFQYAPPVGFSVSTVNN